MGGGWQARGVAPGGGAVDGAGLVALKVGVVVVFEVLPRLVARDLERLHVHHRHPQQLAEAGLEVDHLGPVVVNTDGTLSRITNWQAMTEDEKSTAKRLIAKRNVRRLQSFQDAGTLKAELVSALRPQPPGKEQHAACTS